MYTPCLCFRFRPRLAVVSGGVGRKKTTTAATLNELRQFSAVIGCDYYCAQRGGDCDYYCARRGGGGEGDAKK